MKKMASFPFFLCRGIHGSRLFGQLPGPGPQVRPRAGHGRRGQEGQPVGGGKAKLHHGERLSDYKQRAFSSQRAN